MPIPHSYPGVYVEEIPSGVRTITGVSTSIAAFVGPAQRGPVNEPVSIFNFGDYEHNFGGLWEQSPMSFAVRDFFRNGGGEAVIVRVYNPPTNEIDSGASQISFSVGTGDDVANFLTLVAASPGSWGNKITATIEHVKTEEEGPQIFNLSLTEEGGVSENFLNVTSETGKGNSVKQMLKQGSKLVRLKTLEDSFPNLKPGDNDPAVQLTSTLSVLGVDGQPLELAQFTEGGKPGKKGIFALEKTDIFNLLCIPPFSTSVGNDKARDIDPAIIPDAVAYCENRRAMLLIDPPSSWNDKKTAITNFSNNTFPNSKSNYAALFFPRLMQANPLMNNQIEDFVPCGAVAGIFAKTDAQRGVWKAPAGTDATLNGVQGFSVPLTDDENGKLNPLGINCLRSFPVYGRVVWGARTLAGADQLASEWKYIPVRRTALFIEESLYRGLKWVVFEPNDEPLWAQIRLNVGAFMNNLFRQGAFQGQKKDAYFVKCDAETTTQNDINNGIVNILVGFAPLKPAEFVFIKLQQMAGQIDV